MMRVLIFAWFSFELLAGFLLLETSSQWEALLVVCLMIPVIATLSLPDSSV